MSTTQQPTQQPIQQPIQQLEELLKSLQTIDDLKTNIMRMKSDIPPCEPHEVAPLINKLKEERLNFERLALLVCPDDKRESLETAISANRENSTCESRKAIDDIVDAIMYTIEAREYFKFFREVLVENIEMIDKIIKDGDEVKEYISIMKFSKPLHVSSY